MAIPFGQQADRRFRRRTRARSMPDPLKCSRVNRPGSSSSIRHRTDVGRKRVPRPDSSSSMIDNGVTHAKETTPAQLPAT
ncbi:hypothetical protein G7Y41_00285 [Schaalia sp. ZJ405]|uniref:hypothetical protein n=1 Tax=Schaalia sp. ZJ405 TaxID=2709403 RepID=UPI0013EDABD4|nr:hypothetical protein [Schaalia sp. ZJ405]QPK81365.1 hypothetical protein G7Y41_00285 [Schaalia sp. ZJ405]